MKHKLFLGGAAVGSLILVAGVAFLSAAPGGDLSKQQPKYHIAHIPPAPVLSPDEELKTFRLPPGFHMELVAAEPTVEEPICLTFDPDGRMYVVELRAYMPDTVGTGELNPEARVVRLESSHNDGKFDKRTVFLDHLVLPRAVGLAGDGVLVAEPPNVMLCGDTKNAGVCDQKKTIFTDYASKNPDPEHMANGLVRCMDNWYYSANWGIRFRYIKGEFLRDPTISRGQWGICQDDVGRLFYNSNSSMLRCDVFAAQYLTRNPYITSPAGVNVDVAGKPGQIVHAARVNPGINRGYTDEANLDGTLNRVTAACGPAVYRGDQYPPGYEGNVFVCEPAGNMVIREQLTQKGVNITCKSVPNDTLEFLGSKVEFLTSQDERFRPVSLYTAPDGTLYLIDMYHGILQHKAYLSSYLADQVKKRNLEDRGEHRGRIWRIVSDATKPVPQPHLSTATVAELVKTLSHPNGWWRDTAQRLLVERQDAASVPLLEKLVTSNSAGDVPPLARIHAIWSLQGMDKLTDDVAAIGAKDADPRVRLAALQAADVLLHKHLAPKTETVMAALGDDPDPNVQLQVVATGSADLPDVQKTALGILAHQIGDPIFRCAVMNAATGREQELLQSLLSNPNLASSPDGMRQLVLELSECIVRARSADRIEALLDFIGNLPAPEKQWQTAMLSGVSDAVHPNAKSKVRARVFRLTRQPPAMPKLLSSKDAKVKELAEKIESGMSWPNKPGDKTPPLKPLTAAEQARFETGRVLFTQICAQCHQPSGLGQEGLAPPLVDSEWVLGPQQRLGRIVLNGVHGPINVGRKTVELEMPALGALEDGQISSVLTYIRREWGHEGSPVEPETVTAIRKETSGRGDQQWTMEELMQIK
jgi:mono/diheme cytochrome c family protein/glucose/arabinose dehydrogenase